MKKNTIRALSTLMLIILPVSAALASGHHLAVFNHFNGISNTGQNLPNPAPSSPFSFLQNDRFSVSSSRNGPQTTRGIIEDNHWDDPESGETLCWTDSATDEENTPAWLQYYKARDAGGEIDLTLWQNLVFVGEVEIS